MPNTKKTVHVQEPEKEKPILPEVIAYENHIKDMLNKRYQSLVKRLETESNIINRYEIKLSLESVLSIYQELFPNG